MSNTKRLYEEGDEVTLARRELLDEDSIAFPAHKLNTLKLFIDDLCEIYEPFYLEQNEMDKSALKISPKDIKEYRIKLRANNEFSDLNSWTYAWTKSQLQTFVTLFVALQESKLPSSNNEMVIANKTRMKALLSQIILWYREVLGEHSEYDDNVKNVYFSAQNFIASYPEFLKHTHIEVLEHYNKMLEKKYTEIADKLSSNSDTIQNQLSSFRGDLQTQSSNIETEFNNKIESLIQEKNAQIREEAAAFESLNRELSEQLGIIGSQTQANRNIAQANKEKSVADTLRNIGTFWLAALSLYAAVFFEKMLSSMTLESFDFSLLLARWLIVFLLTLPGIYLLRESSRHRADERKYRQLGVQLATINSYLEGFSEESKLKIKQDLTSNFFSSTEAKIDDSSVPDLMKSFEKSLDAVIQIAKRK
ncbi:TPA: hypothetical protein ACPJ1R_002056 [Vibrio alginolyticus]